MLVRSKFFPQFVEKVEKLEPSLSKQHNKMLKTSYEMLKIRKNGKIIELGKITRNFPNPGNPVDFQDPDNFSFPGKSKIREKRKPYNGKGHYVL